MDLKLQVNLKIKATVDLNSDVHRLDGKIINVSVTGVSVLMLMDGSKTVDL